MKTVAASIAYFAALMAVVWFGAGCATVGDGKLEPVTKATAKAALTAGSISVPAGLGQDASAISITPVEGGALAGVDVLAASDAVASDGWTGIHPVVFLKRNWKGILAASGTALAAYAAYEVYDHQHDSKKSKSAEGEEEEDPALEIPDITGGVVVTAVEGDGNTITTYFYSPQN